MFLADACALPAFLGAGGAGMSRDGIDAMRAADVAVSAITVWELAREAGVGKLPPLPRCGGSSQRHLSALGFGAEALPGEDGEAARLLPPHHKDPMDRMRIATALRTGRVVITSDAVFSRYGVATVW
jgi:PIN domain nuclease of toxin-antitoxin system